LTTELLRQESVHIIIYNTIQSLINSRYSKYNHNSRA